MLTKEYLDEYKKKTKNYNYEIEKITKQLNIEYRSTSIDSVSGSIRYQPYTKTHIKIEGINQRKIKQLEKRREIFEKKKSKIYKELKYKLDNLEDRLLADIIELKYIKKLSWTQIAIKTSYAGESGVRNYFNRYFEKNNLCDCVRILNVKIVL